MSRKNRKYGSTFLEKRFNIFVWRWDYVLYGWTHRGCGPWWAPQSRTTVVKYVIGRFDSLAEYKRFYRGKRNKRKSDGFKRVRIRNCWFWIKESEA